MGSETDVNIDSVNRFGGRMLDVLGTFGEGTAQPLKDVVSGRLGGSALAEANMARNYHGALSEISLEFLKDVMSGLGALGYGAQTIAINYQVADESAQGEMAEVEAAFNPTYQQPNLAADMQNNPTGMGGQVNLPEPEPTPDSGVCELTPEDQVQAHQDEYGDKEDWVPPGAEVPDEMIVAPGQVSPGVGVDPPPYETV